MSVTTTTTDVKTWLRNRRKDELVSIILANLDRIDLFRDLSDFTDRHRMDALEAVPCCEIVAWAADMAGGYALPLRKFADDLIAKRKEGK